MPQPDQVAGDTNIHNSVVGTVNPYVPVNEAGDCEVGHICPICWDNADDATVGGEGPAMCYACGQGFCGRCRVELGETQESWKPKDLRWVEGLLYPRRPLPGACPMCHATSNVSPRENYMRVWRLLHEHPPGRHTAGAQLSLGVMHNFGHGVVEDRRAAFQWYHKAAEQGSAEGQCMVGIALVDGDGVAKDEAAGMTWLGKATLQQDAKAQFHLGMLAGRFDEAAGVWWYRQSAEQGFPLAQMSLANALLRGRGVTQDIAAAVRWYRKGDDRVNPTNPYLPKLYDELAAADLPPAGQCCLCTLSSPDLKKCSRCGEVAYCCKECQVAHWKRRHKNECGLKAEASNTAVVV